jgi:hypothetical protein
LAWYPDGEVLKTITIEVGAHIGSPGGNGEGAEPERAQDGRAEKVLLYLFHGLFSFQN